MRAAIWTRVSSREQETSNQLPALRKLARSRGFKVVKTYAVEESAYTGAHRGALAQALEDARLGEYDVLLVWALDRLSREGVEQTLSLLRRFSERGVRVISLQEGWTDGPPETQELLISIMAWVAQVASKRRSERIKAGIARRKADGLPVGRLPGAKDVTKRKRSGYVARYERERASS